MTCAALRSPLLCFGSPAPFFTSFECIGFRAANPRVICCATRQAAWVEARFPTCAGFPAFGMTASAPHMSGFLFAFIAALLAGIGARDQLTVAGLAARNGQRLGLLAVAVLCAAMTGVIAGWAAGLVVPLLEGNARAGQVLIAVALAFAGAEMLVLGARKPPEEPTQSLGATGIVLTAHQLTDAARFFIFAIAAATAAPIPAGAGGAVGGIAVVALGWIAAEDMPLKLSSIVRRSLGVVALLLAVWFAMHGLGRWG